VDVICYRGGLETLARSEVGISSFCFLLVVCCALLSYYIFQVDFPLVLYGGVTETETLNGAL